MQAACELEGQSEALDYALYAFCSIQVHITDKSGETTIQDVWKSYNDAIQRLRTSVEEPALQSDETLAAIAVLSTCEVGFCSLSSIGVSRSLSTAIYLSIS